MPNWVLVIIGLTAIVVGMYYTIGSIGGSNRRLAVGNTVALVGFALLIAGVNNILSEDDTYVCVEVTE